MPTDFARWHKEPGARVQGSRPLDASKVQAPGIVRLPDRRFRLFYTAIGPQQPFPRCQGLILSAGSHDGLDFRVEPGIRLAPDARVSHMSRRVLAPTFAPLPDGRWRMYFESRGPADRPTVIGSAISTDLFAWTVEPGVRLVSPGGGDVGGPRFVRLPDGGGRIVCFDRAAKAIVSARTEDGLAFAWEPGTRLVAASSPEESAGVTAADVIPPQASGDRWTMLYSAWQDVPPGTAVPHHPSQDPALESSGGLVDFAAASIAADMAGYRSRIFVAFSDDGLTWERGGCVIEGDGYGGSDIDAVHAEDMCVTPLPDGRWRMYYAACDATGTWRVASAVTG